MSGQDDPSLITEQHRQKRYQQKSVSVVLKCDDPVETAVSLEQRLFRSGHAAVIVSAEDALAVCPYVEAAGLIAIVAGYNKPIPFGIHFETDNPDEIVEQLRKQQVLLAK